MAQYGVPIQPGIVMQQHPNVRNIINIFEVEIENERWREGGDKYLREREGETEKVRERENRRYRKTNRQI